MFLFDGLALGWQIYFTVALVVVLVMLAWTAVLFVRSARPLALARYADSDDFIWIFLVPALNEEVTIADSVSRLLALPVPDRRVIVIDDGSDDGTPDVLAGIDHPDLRVIRRDLPDARRGKAAALNQAYRLLAENPEELDRDRAIIAVVDADGRLGPEAPAYAAVHFADPRVGGVQSQVRIYNRSRILTWMQDIEFGVYGRLFQVGRNGWGTAGMGGNGQFNRLIALDDVADEEGPWKDRLTEDQDLGLRLLAKGWHGRQELVGAVDQQGLPRLRPLLRQRTRWSQGNLQAMDLLGTVMRAPFPLSARMELFAYLLMPVWQGIVGVAFISAIVLAAFGGVPLWAGGLTWELLAVYLLGFGGTLMGTIAARRGRGWLGPIRGFLVGHLYALYSLLLWPVLLRSLVRQLMGRDSWAKTAREPIEWEAPPAG